MKQITEKDNQVVGKRLDVLITSKFLLFDRCGVSNCVTMRTVCMCVGVGGWVLQMHTYMYLHWFVGQRVTSNIFLQVLPEFSFEIGVLVGLELQHVGRLVSFWGLSAFTFHVTITGISTACHHDQLFTWVLRGRSQILTLSRKALTK